MDSQIRTIVVGVGGEEEAAPFYTLPADDPVVEPAAALAHRLGARLHVVHALERHTLRRGCADVQKAADARGHRVVEAELQLWATTRHFPNADRIHCHAVSGKADLQLCAFAEEVGADLVIVGAALRGGSERPTLGDTAASVLRRSGIPVLVVRRPLTERVRRVLLTTDLSELSPALYDTGIGIVEKLFGAEPLEMHALLVSWYDAALAARISRESMVHVATAQLQAFLGERRPGNHPVNGRVRIGNPSTEILRAADEWQAELLVVGSRGSWSASSWLLGSTAAATLRGARCNVLVIPAAAASRTAHPGDEPDFDGDWAGFPGTEEHDGAAALLAAV